MPRPGLHQYVTNTTLPYIRGTAGMPLTSLPGHRNSQNCLTIRSEAWRRLEIIYQIDALVFARKVIKWTSSNIPNVPFEHRNTRSTEVLSLGTRRRDGTTDRINFPVDTIDRLAALLYALPLNSAQRLLHILFPDTRQWKFKQQEGFDVDCKIFGYFLWTKTQRYDQASQNAVVLAYQPPCILNQTEFKDFIKCSSLPPHIPPGRPYTSDLQSQHKIWAKLWDTCVKHDTKWFVITSWNIWAFGCFSDDWCSGMISDVWHLDEHTPNILECLTYWIASAMGHSGTYQRPRVGRIDSKNPGHINRPAQLSDVAHQGPDVFFALSKISA